MEAHRSNPNSPPGSPPKISPLHHRVSQSSEMPSSPTTQQTGSRISQQSQSAEAECNLVCDYLNAGNFDMAIKLFQDMALSDTPETKEANYRFGLAYKNGWNDHQRFQNLELAAKHFQKAHLQGHLGATYQYGMMMFKGYENSEGKFVQNDEIARQCFEKICVHHSQSSSSSSLQKPAPQGFQDIDDWMEQDDEELCQYYQQTNRHPHPSNSSKTEQDMSELGDAHLCLGNIYDQGLDIEKNGAIAAQQYEQAHCLGISEATYLLGCKHFFGAEIRKNYWTAHTLFTQYTQQIPNQDDTNGIKFYRNACFYLGYMHEMGYGSELSDEVASGFYQKAADFDHPIAMFYLAKNCARGFGVEQNIPKAQQLFKKVVPIFEQEIAKQDHPDYCFFLGQCYEYACGVDGDLPKAVDLYRRAAKAGNVEAAHKYGVMLFVGQVIPQNYSLALPFFHFAHKNGHKYAQSYIHQINGLIAKQGTPNAQETKEQVKPAQQIDQSEHSPTTKPILETNDMVSN